tara:strand:- start:136 stop:705 length:570 start_codon:yes stop_codon:yes gene_type:complete
MRISLFPSPVVYRECLEHPKLLDWIKEYRKTADHDSASSSCGWHSPYDLHRNEDFTIFFLWFYSELATSIAELTPSQFEVVSMWASVNSPGEYNIGHQHLGVDLSAVMWLQSPTNCGNFIFENDSALTRYKLLECTTPEDKEKLNFYDSTWFYPKPWSLLVFPADLRHRVDRNASDEDRISIGANIKLL